MCQEYCEFIWLWTLNLDTVSLKTIRKGRQNADRTVIFRLNREWDLLYTHSTLHCSVLRMLTSMFLTIFLLQKMHWNQILVSAERTANNKYLRSLWYKIVVRSCSVTATDDPQRIHRLRLIVILPSKSKINIQLKCIRNRRMLLLVKLLPKTDFIIRQHTSPRRFLVRKIIWCTWDLNSE